MTSTIPYREDYYPSHFVELNGAYLHYKRAGKGPPVLLLHGYPETWYTWRHTIAALMPYFTVFAPDLRGWGQSEGPGPYGLRTLVDDTVAMLRFWERKFPTMHVVGHDWGGAITFALRKAAPERLGKIVTINMPVKRFDMTKTLHLYAFNTPLVPELVMRYQSDWVVERILRWWSYNHDAFPPDVVAAYQAAARRPQANAATRGYYRNTFRTALFRRAESYGLGQTQPQNTDFDWLCLWGANDPVSPMKNVAYFKEDAPGVPVELVPDAGHFPQEENPGVFNQKLLDFLQR